MSELPIQAEACTIAFVVCAEAIVEGGGAHVYPLAHAVDQAKVGPSAPVLELRRCCATVSGSIPTKVREVPQTWKGL